MKVLVCGGRDFADRDWLNRSLDKCHNAIPITKIIEGGALGADRLAREWAIESGVDYITFEADWHTHGRAAGPIRNKQMLDEGKPDQIIAFPGGRGTANMVKQATDSGLPVILVEPN